MMTTTMTTISTKTKTKQLLVSQAHLVPGAADSWYHEKESAWLYRAVAAAEPDPARRALFEKLAAAAEEQAACWRRARSSLPDGFLARRCAPGWWRDSCGTSSRATCARCSPP